MFTLCLQKQVVLSCNLRPSGFDYYKIEDNLPLLPPQWSSCFPRNPVEKAAWSSRATPSLIPPKKIFYCMNHAASVNQDLFYFVWHWPKEVIVTAKRKAATKWVQDTELCLAGRKSPLSLHPCLSPVAHLGQLQAWTWMRPFLFV